MGCFNETCYISHLPIIYHTKSVLIPLIENKFNYRGKNSHCYIDDVWKVFGYPLKGEYNDYSSLENISNGDLLYKFIKKYEFEKNEETLIFNNL